MPKTATAANSTGSPRFVYATARIAASTPAARCPGNSGMNASRVWRMTERPSSTQVSTATSRKLTVIVTSETANTTSPKLMLRVSA